MIMNWKKKAGLIFLLMVFVLGSGRITLALNQDELPEAVQRHFEALQDNEGNLSKWSHASFEGLAADLYLQLVGAPNEETGQLEGGVLGGFTNLIASTYLTPPASGVYYLADTFSRLGASPVYAQGIGFTGLQPILPVWRAFRDLTYLLFALVFVFIGLAVMLRVKVSPQAVLTIQNALPRLVVALVLVTFSYAIAGFLIDLMYVSIGLGVNLLRTAGVTPGGPIEPTPKNVIHSGVFAVLPALGWGGGGVTLLGMSLGFLIGSILGPIGAALGSTAGSLLFVLIFVFVAIFLVVKLFVGLIKAYISIIIQIITAPLQIIAGVFPGSNIGFGTWLKGLIANLLVFPAVALCLIIGSFIIRQAAASANPLSAAGNIWLPPLLTPPDFGPLHWVSFFHRLATTVFAQALLGLGFLMLTANIPDIIRQMFGIKKGIFALGIGATVGPAIGVATWPFRTAGGIVRGGVEKYAIDTIEHKANQLAWGQAQRWSWLRRILPPRR